MAETMIERVAKAIYEGRNGSGCKPWARLTKSHQNPYILDALNALHEMREPTPQMVDAAWTCTQSVDPEERMAIDLMNTRVAHEHKARKRYRAMIDAALSEGGE